MKSNYTYKRFIDKCVSIYNKIKLDKEKLTIEDSLIQNVVVEIQNVVIEEKIKEKKTIVKGNKLTPDEIRENARLRKQKQRDSLKERYGNDAYNKMHAKEIAEQRKKKNE
jgi:hypothetical protein